MFKVHQSITTTFTRARRGKGDDDCDGGDDGDRGNGGKVTVVAVREATRRNEGDQEHSLKHDARVGGNIGDVKRAATMGHISTDSHVGNSRVGSSANDDSGGIGAEISRQKEGDGGPAEEHRRHLPRHTIGGAAAAAKATARSATVVPY